MLLLGHAQSTCEIETDPWDDDYLIVTPGIELDDFYTYKINGVKCIPRWNDITKCKLKRSPTTGTHPLIRRDGVDTGVTCDVPF